MSPMRPKETKSLAQSAAVPDSQSSKTFNISTFEEYIFYICNKRYDMLPHHVMNRLQNSIDLHAADCQYHPDCYQKLIKKKTSTCTKVSNHETSLNTLTEQASHIWNSVEVFNTYVGLGGSHSRKSLITELQSHFDKDLIVMHVSGSASIIEFRSHISYKLQLVDDDQDDESVDNLVSKIKQETSVLPGI